ncbi:GNAT family N-acetyltransferase [Shewanella sp. Scap07]|uniref:GNAT family N-acetyltransferase n=1 Tax=Shewanella sp. Scap07 TaxID=2589987 RepID=UPI0015BA0F56|nr:GNAT family N-acetyltransferase [Shewanella sp. Scap07]QLE84894.1 GNAT family N-acetyltransferase [Shewanella sp. Scap07]
MTVNIQVRHSSDSDIAAIKAIYAQPSCYANTLQLPHPSIEQWQARLSGTHEHFYSLVAEVEGAVVGQLGMEVFASPRRKHVANIGMAVDENHRGQQVGEALMQQAVELANDWLAITRIELEVYTDNHAAISLYQRFGFVIEGTAKAYAFRGGEFIDAHLMAKVGR